MKKTKLFYLSTSLNIGGTENFLLTLAQKLSGGCDITVGVLKAGGAVENQLKDIGINVISCPMPWQLIAYLKKHDIVVLHTFLFWAHIFGRVCGKLAGTPVIITTQQAVDIWKKPYHTFLDKVTAPLSDYFIANSAAAAGRLKKIEKVPGEKIGVVYNGVDAAAFRTDETREEIRKELKIPSSSFVVACVSRLHHDKGVDFLPEIALKAPGCVFLVAGNGPLMSGLAAGIKRSMLGSRFILCGWRRDIGRILKASDVFILPSREESFPQAALEAMACGLPVIASDIGGVNELVDDSRNGFLVKPGDTAGFASALNRLMGDRALAAAMSKASFEKAALFGETKMVAAVADIYTNLLSSMERPSAR